MLSFLQSSRSQTRSYLDAWNRVRDVGLISLAIMEAPAVLRAVLIPRRTRTSIIRFLAAHQRRKSLFTMGQTGYFPYEPSSVGAILAMLLFGGSAIFHTVQMTRTRTWFFTAFLVGAYSKHLIHSPKPNSYHHTMD